MKRFVTLLFLLVMSLSAETTMGQLQQELRVALVVANSSYDESPLDNALENGRKMRDYLEKHRFTVIYAEDVNKREFVKLIRKFSRKMKPNCLSLFYYNGHAVQLNGENMIVPTETSISTDKHLGYQGIPVDTVASLMRKALNRLNIVIIDAAYPKPFGSRYQPAKRGLAPFKAQKQFHFILAKQPNTLSRSTDFTGRFIRTFAEEPTDIRSGIQQMIDNSKGAEQPWIVHDKKERFFFVLPESLGVNESAIWNKVHALNTIKAYSAFVKEYPKSRYVEEAEKALQELQSAADARQKQSDTKKTPEAKPLKSAANAAKREAQAARIQKYKQMVSAQQQEQIERYKEMLKKRGIEIIEPQMATVHAGSFMMGSDTHDISKPRHKVSIENGFKIGVCEVTYHEYAQYLKAINKYPTAPEQWRGEKQPVINVTWQQANNYAQWLRRYTGKPYRLPSEAEWEYAASAGKDTLYPWGSEENLSVKHAWMKQNSGTITHECGALTANAFGLFDMAGNVWEWVADDAQPHQQDAPAEGTIQTNGSGTKVLKGGSWSDTVVSIAPHHRRFEPVNFSANTVGFRLLLEEI